MKINCYTLVKPVYQKYFGVGSVFFGLGHVSVFTLGQN